MSDLRRAEVWSGRHRGIGFQIRKHMTPGYSGSPDYPVWCYYLFLSEVQVPKAKHAGFFLEPTCKKFSEAGPEHITYDYYNCAFNDLDSWHGGLTYYDYEESISGHRCVKVGCDWNHAWDHAEYDPFSLDMVEHECRATVDEFCDQHPDLLVRCSYTGTFHPAEDMEPYRDGFISAAGIKARDKWNAEDRALKGEA